METASRRWYIIQTYSGFENSVKEDLEHRIESMGMKDLIFQVMLPEEIEIETKADGSKKERVRKMFPGYIFVEMIVTDESWFVVRNTPKVTGFLGSSGGGTKPVPLPPDEINLLLKKIGKVQDIALDYIVGDKVTVVSGSMNGQVGEVESINKENQTVSVSLELFGRKTVMDFDLNAVKKA